jgi:hypothetical protein
MPRSITIRDVPDEVAVARQAAIGSEVSVERILAHRDADRR